jgi:hypothetical protein
MAEKQVVIHLKSTKYKIKLFYLIHVHSNIVRKKQVPPFPEIIKIQLTRNIFLEQFILQPLI